jgi:hypothetical protein
LKNRESGGKIGFLRVPDPINTAKIYQAEKISTGIILSVGRWILPDFQG